MKLAPKKSRRDRMMRSKSFDTPEVRVIGRKKAREIVSDGRKEMQNPGKVENVKKKIHIRARKML